MLQMRIAKELGYTLSEITDRLTEEELMLWAAFWSIEKEDADKMARRRK